MAAHANHLPPGLLAWNVFLFGTGAFIMRGAGCTINDMWDRRLDANVSRTRTRPLASGAVTPFQALVFTGVQLSAGLAVLLQLNWYSILLGASSLSLVVIYPLMKRITYWPQLVLGLAFNWGALLGWSAMVGTCSGALNVLLPLYAGSICWTLVYDTIYAHQDKRDDVGVGIKSTALLFGDSTKTILSGFSVATLTLLAASVRQMDHAKPYLLNTEASTVTQFLTDGHPFFVAALATSAAHFFWQIQTVRLDDRADCWSKFRSNTVLGAIIWAGLLLDYAVQVAWADKAETDNM
jgi:4-hydroxybenzoate polyprenyltransferase